MPDATAANRHRRLSRICFIAIAAGLGLSVAPASAQQANLAGSWRGGGTVLLSSGAREQARCQARFQAGGGGSFGMTAVCATSDARITQTATLDRVGPNRFVGDFYNPDFGVSGSIRITVNGDTLTASLKGDAGSAILTLRR